MENSVRCPTCGARQEWSECCRRCKSDLRLLRRAAASYLRSRHGCLAALREGRGAEARFYASTCHGLDPGSESRRLLALCALIEGDWAAAAAWGREVIEATESPSTQ